MRKFPLIAALILLLTLPALANKKAADSSEKFRIKPRICWTSLTPLIVHITTKSAESEFGLGLTIIGANLSLFEYKNFKFFSFGVRLRAYQELIGGWHSYYYAGYNYPYCDLGYRFFTDACGKFVPVKWKWVRMSEALKLNASIEIGITHKKDIIIGLSFSGNPFKKI